MPRRTAVIAALLLALAGCSSSGNGPEPDAATTPTASASATPTGNASAAPSTPAAIQLEVDPEREGMPEADGDVEELLAAVTAAADTGSCEELAPLVLSEIRPTSSEVDAGEPARPEECAALGPYLETLKGVTYTHTTLHGPTALAWGEGDGRSATLLLVADTDGTRRIAAAFGGTGKHRDVAGGSEEAQQTVSSFLEALRTGNCEALAAAAVQDPNSGLYQGSLDNERMCAGQAQRQTTKLLEEEDPTRLHVLAETSFGALYGVPAGERYLVFHVTQQPEAVTAAEPERPLYGVQDHYTVLVEE